MGLLNKIYRLVQAGRCLFNMFYDDTFEKPEADPRVFRKFDDAEVEIVVVVHVDSILAHAQATMERFAAELGGKFKLKSMVNEFGVKKEAGHQLFRGCQPSLKTNEQQTPEEEEHNVEVPVPEGNGDAHVDDNDATARYCERCTRCGQVLEKSRTGALQKDGDARHTLPGSHERVGNHVW